MAISPDILEVRQQAQILLTEHGSPLPGDLNILKAYSQKLKELEQEVSITSGRWENASALTNLYLYLRAPGITEAALHSQGEGSKSSINLNSERFNQVLAYIELLPLREVRIPRRGYSLTIWSSHWDAEETLSLAAVSAFRGEHSLTLPTLTLDECSIKFSPRKDSIWSVTPQGDIWVKHGENKPRRSTANTSRFINMVNTAADYFTAQSRN